MISSGIKGHTELVVTEDLTAAAVGSGLLKVFSTPSMIAAMEKAAYESVAPFLDEGQGTVGIHMACDHTAAVPVGRSVRVESLLESVDGKILTFHIEAFSDIEKIGEATHKRCIISDEKFLSRLSSKYGDIDV